MVEFEEPKSLKSQAQKDRWNLIKQFRPLLATMRVLTNKSLAPLFRNMLDEFDEALFDLSDKAKNNAQQIEYFDLMRSIRKRREEIENTFFQRVHDGCEHFIQGTLYQEQQQGLELALMAKDHLEQSLAGKRVMDKALALFGAEISALNQRYAVINGGVKPGEDSIALPSGPAQIVNAFEYALQLLQLPQEAVLLVFELFEVYVISQMGPLYQRLNEHMVRANILPNLKVDAYSKIIKQPDQPPRRRRQDAEPAAISHEEKAFFMSISTMLASKRDESELFSSELTQIKAKREELIGALSQIQAQEKTISTLKADLQSFEGFKDVITQQLKTISKDMSVSAADADIIDLVGMMFEFVLNDPSLSDAVKALLSHLHTPFLKVGIIDKQFFTSRQHPSRQLLNMMVKTANKNHLDAQDSLGVYSKLQLTVERILNEFKEDTEFFEVLLHDFTVFADSIQHKTQNIEERAVAAVKGQENLSAAREKTTMTIARVLQNRRLPDAMTQVITGPWANLLVLTLLPKSKFSGRWDECMAVVDELVALENRSDDWRHRLQVVLGKIKRGLSVIGYPQAEADALLQDLSRLQEPDAVPQTDVIEEQDNTPVDEEAPLVCNDDETLSAEEEKINQQLKELPFGTWFDFYVHDEKRRMRVKLAWFSPGTLNYMFVNQSGAKMGIKPIDQLMREIVLKETQIIAEEAQQPFVDRALDFVMRRLKKTQQAEG